MLNVTYHYLTKNKLLELKMKVLGKHVLVKLLTLLIFLTPFTGDGQVLLDTSIVSHSNKAVLTRSGAQEEIKDSINGFPEIALVKLRTVCAPSYPEIPLYILDGKVIDREVLTESIISKIDTVIVLTNTKATDTYGESGRNGVIIIETKKKNGR